ncbi:MAG TPA: hypothetical protein VF331_28360 [Polyangiales bacterium]
MRAPTLTAGAPGQDGQRSTVQASGGAAAVGTAASKAGGNGGALGVAPAAGGTVTTTSAAAGGGAAGRIRLNAGATVVTTGAIIRPAQSTGTATIN